MFINRLLALINEKEISRKQFSEDVHINKNQLKRWEDLGTVPNRTTLIVIAQYFNVSVEYLLGETDVRKEKSPAGAELSEKHKKLIDAYDGAEPLVQSTVDRLLGIEERETITLKIAARGGSGKIEEKEITKEQWEQIKNAADLEI